MRRYLPKFLLFVFSFALALAPVWANLISIPYVFVAGQTLPAAQLNADFATIYNAFNGNITNANINAAAAIAASKINFTGASIPLTALAAQNTYTFVANITSGSASPTAITYAQVNAALPVFTSTLNGLTPLSGGGTTNYLRADGTWDAPPGTAGSGTVNAAAQGLLPFYSSVGSVNVVSGNPSIFTGNSGTGVLNLGIVGAGATTGELFLSNGGSYSTAIQCGASQLQNVSINLPITNGTSGQLWVCQDSSGDIAYESVSGDATLANTGALTLKNTGPGTGTFLNANVTIDNQGRVTGITNGSGAAQGGFGGGGTAGAISYSTDQTPTGPVYLDAASITTSGTIGYTPSASPVVWNSQSSINVASGTTITMTALGPGAQSNRVCSGGGLGGAQSFNTGTATGGAGGGYGNIGGIGGAAASAVISYPGSSYPYSITGGSGGANGQITTGADGTGGSGGGTFTACSLGNLTIAGVLNNLGQAGNVGSPGSGVSGGGGGSGGSVGLNSQAQIIVSGTINLTGGAGANATTNGGGGGAPGRCLGISAVAANLSGATLTQNGGAGGTGTHSGNAGVTGSTCFVWVTATPNAPILGYLYKQHGIDSLYAALDNGSSPYVRNLAARVKQTDKGMMVDGREFLRLCAQGDLQRFIQLATCTDLDPNGASQSAWIGDGALPEGVSNAV